MQPIFPFCLCAFSEEVGEQVLLLEVFFVVVELVHLLLSLDFFALVFHLSLVKLLLAFESLCKSILLLLLQFLELFLSLKSLLSHFLLIILDFGVVLFIKLGGDIF